MLEQYHDTVEKWLYDPFVGKVITIIVFFLIFTVIKSFIKKLITKKVTNINSRYKAKKFLSFAFFISIVLITSVIFNDKLQGLTVAFGVAGAGIAFALQEVISSIAGWFAITFAGFFSVGDRVQLGGIRGDVIDIGILRTTLMECGAWVDGDLYNGRVVRIANSFAFKEPVFNYSADFPFLWDEIKIPIQHGSDLNAARELIEKVADEVQGHYEEAATKEWKNLVRKFVIEDARVSNFVSMTADQNCITFTLRYVTDFKSRRLTKDKLFVQIIEDISNHKDVSIAGATIEITNLKDLKST